MKNVILLLTVIAMTCSVAISEEETNTVIVRQIKGQGSTRDQAIKNALYHAVGQAKGVLVGSGEYEFGYDSATVDVDRSEDRNRKTVSFDAVSVETQGTLSRTEIAGLVKSYEVLDERKIDDNTYEVTLKVLVHDYAAPGKTKRLKLAVMPIKVFDTSFSFGDHKMSAIELSHKISQKLNTALTQTNKFALLDRRHMDDFAKERNILLSDDTSLEEKAKIGKVLGADYILVGTVTDAKLIVKERASRATGRKVREYEADFGFDYRLLVGPTRQVKLSDTVNISFDKVDEIRKLVKKWRPNDLDHKEISDNLIKLVANKVTQTVIDEIFAIRIAAITKSGQIVINQGGKRIKKGLLLNVFTPGEEIIDADTNESLGNVQSIVAIIKVDKVSSKISYAKLAEGDKTKLSKGLICRQKNVKLRRTPGKKSDVQRSPTGGVKLPFD